MLERLIELRETRDTNLNICRSIEARDSSSFSAEDKIQLDVDYKRAKDKWLEASYQYEQLLAQYIKETG